MLKKTLIFMLSITMFISCSSKTTTNFIGHFNTDKDLLLLQFDCKTDVDDLHSVAGATTILSDPRFANVNYHAVIGTYGIQEGLYVPANELFEAAFGNNWSDAHTNYIQSLEKVTAIVNSTLENGGDIWIAEAGQSDFTSSIIQNIQEAGSTIKTDKRIHVVQHSDWNENSTCPENMQFVKVNSDYSKIPDGNEVGNGSPGLRTSKHVDLEDYISTPKLSKTWKMAIELANKYNGQEGRYNNPAIAAGGLDFSDVSEICWIFGFEKIGDISQFLKEFGVSIK